MRAKAAAECRNATSRITSAYWESLPNISSERSEFMRKEDYLAPINADGQASAGAQAPDPAALTQVDRLALELGQPMVISETESTRSLLASVQVMRLDMMGRLLDVPKATAGAIIEIGCSDFDTADQKLLPTDPNAFLLSFEPLLDKYAVLLARGTESYHHGRPDMAVPLGHHHKRGVILPFAVSARGGYVNFTVASRAGCSSMLPIQNTAQAAAPWCAGQLERRRVPSISLASAIGLLPDEIPIKLIKIDAQGVDFTLISETPPSLLQRRVQSIQMEVRSPTCPTLYRGQTTCEAVEALMKSMGYRSRGGKAVCPPGRGADGRCHLRHEVACCEANAIFDRADP